MTAPSCIVDLQPLDLERWREKRPFFCVHPVSGSVSRYYDLARHLGRDRPFFGIQSAGLDGREPPLTRIPRMAARYAREIRAIQPAGAILLGGWSLGGIIAFETARQLAAAGEDIALLAIIDAKAPGFLSIERRDPVQLLIDLFPDELHSIETDLRRVDRDERLALAYEHVRRADRVPAGFTLAWFRTYFDVFEANCESIHAYRTQPCELAATLFRASEDLAREPGPPAVGWNTVARGGVAVIPVPGSHASLVSEPQVVVLAERLNAAMARAEAGRPADGAPRRP